MIISDFHKCLEGTYNYLIRRELGCVCESVKCFNSLWIFYKLCSRFGKMGPKLQNFWDNFCDVSELTVVFMWLKATIKNFSPWPPLVWGIPVVDIGNRKRHKRKWWKQVTVQEWNRKTVKRGNSVVLCWVRVGWSLLLVCSEQSWFTCAVLG